MKRFLMVAAAALGLVVGQARAQNFSDTSIGIRNAFTVANPGGNPGDEKGSRNVNKVIVNLEHFDVWDYGTNFFNVDIPVLQSQRGGGQFIRRLNSEFLRSVPEPS